jgi:regulator of replication initiation timing
MINGFNLSQSDWQQTPSPVRIAATSLQHQLYIFNARLNVYQQQNSELRTKLEHLKRIKDEQTAEIKGLKLKATELKERLRQNSANSSLPPSSDSPFQQPESRSASSGRKQGA